MSQRHPSHGSAAFYNSGLPSVCLPKIWQVDVAHAVLCGGPVRRTAAGDDKDLLALLHILAQNRAEIIASAAELNAEGVLSITRTTVLLFAASMSLVKLAH